MERCRTHRFAVAKKLRKGGPLTRHNGSSNDESNQQTKMMITRNRSWLAAVADGVGRLLGLTGPEDVLPTRDPRSACRGTPAPSPQSPTGSQSPHGFPVDRTPDYGEGLTEAGRRVPSVFVAVRRTY